MSVRGFARGQAVAYLVLFAISAVSTASAGEWSGGYIGFKTDYTKLGVDYTNTGTPEQSLSGVMAGVVAGYDFELGPFVAGIAADATFGNLNDFVRDGNYITESGKVSQLSSVRGRLGVPIGDVLPFFTGGVMITNLQQGEVCPDPAAAPFGFCNHGFQTPPYTISPGPFDLKQSKTLVGATFGAGFEYKFAPGWSVQAQFLHTAFPGATYNLGPDSDGNPLPPSVAHPTLDQGSLAFVKRF